MSDQNPNLDGSQSSTENIMHSSLQKNPRELKTSDRVLLASRAQYGRGRNDTRSEYFDETYKYLDAFEKSIKDGFAGLHSKISNLEAERNNLERHVASLEESLRKVQAEKDKICDEGKKLAAELEASISQNKEFQSRISRINSSHDSHLYRIAEQYRNRSLAHKTLYKWKGKLSNKQKVLLLQEENKILKNEVLSCQEGAKKAFIRSANKLNSEALSMFQDSSKRQLESRLLSIPSDDHESSRSSSLSNTSTLSSSDSNQSGSNQRDRFTSPARESDRNRILTSQSRSDSRHSRPHITLHSEGTSNENRPYNLDDYRSNRKRKTSSNDLAREDPRDRDSQPSGYVDPMRRETRQILKQFQTKAQPAARMKDSQWELCSGKNHLHVCHCLPDSGERLGRCPTCSPSQKYNFANMPIDDRASPHKPFSRPKTPKATGSSLGTRRNVTFASTTKNDGRKSVFYKPSGSTVVIEKHLSL